MTEATSDPRRLPTYNNILEAMRWLVRDARPHDSLFFHCMISSFLLSVWILMQVRFWPWRASSRFGRRRSRWLGRRQVTRTRVQPIELRCRVSYFPFGLQDEWSYYWRCKFWISITSAGTSYFSRFTANAWYYGNPMCRSLKHSVWSYFRLNHYPQRADLRYALRRYAFILSFQTDGGLLFRDYSM